MKIIPTNIGGPERAAEKRGKPVSSSSSGAKSAASENVDKITISHGGSISDARFIESLKNRILKETQGGVDIHRLDELKARVESGEYRADPAEIIHKLIGEIDD